MRQSERKKIIIVQGLNDKLRLQRMITEPIQILCTNGTFNLNRFKTLLMKYDLHNQIVYIYVSDSSEGKHLRKQLTRHLPLARHVHIQSQDVTASQMNLLASELERHKLQINPVYLQ